jgi:hypothetical protein
MGQLDIWKEHKDTKARRHKEKAALRVFLKHLFFVPSCLCVFVFLLTLSNQTTTAGGPDLSMQRK